MLRKSVNKHVAQNGRSMVRAISQIVGTKKFFPNPKQSSSYFMKLKSATQQFFISNILM